MFQHCQALKTSPNTSCLRVSSWSFSSSAHSASRKLKARSVTLLGLWCRLCRRAATVTPPGCGTVSLFCEMYLLGTFYCLGCSCFSGSHPVQALRMLDMLGVRTISTSTFFRHQTQYLQPTIICAWQEHQAGLVKQLKADHAKQVILAVDGRSDSPGHCAKFGATSAIEQQIRKVLDVQLVQVGFAHQVKET